MKVDHVNVDRVNDDVIGGEIWPALGDAPQDRWVRVPKQKLVPVNPFVCPNMNEDWDARQWKAYEKFLTFEKDVVKRRLTPTEKAILVLFYYILLLIEFVQKQLY